MSLCSLQFSLLLPFSGPKSICLILCLCFLLQSFPPMFHLYCRGGGKVGKKAVEQKYSYVLAELIIQLGSCHRAVNAGQHEPLK